jgi:hypothetical protein
VYLSNGRTIGAGDTLPAAYLPWSIVLQRNFSLDEFPALHGEDATRIFPLLDGIPYYLLHRNGHYLSAYTPGPGVLAVPIYILPILAGVKPDGVWPARLEKLSAAIITALSVLFLYWALRGVTSPGWTLVIALVYALGTSSLSVSSQGLWQHGPSQLFLAFGLYFLVKGLSDDRYLGYVGLPMAAAIVMRSTNLLLVLPVAAWIVYAHRRRAVSLALWALAPAAALAAYYVAYFGRPIEDSATRRHPCGRSSPRCRSAKAFRACSSVRAAACSSTHRCSSSPSPASSLSGAADRPCGGRSPSASRW